MLMLNKILTCVNTVCGMSVLTVLYLADVCLLELPALHAGCSSWLRLTAGQHPSDVGQCAPALSKTHTFIITLSN